MKKKVISAMLVATLAMGSLTACGGNDGKTEDGKDKVSVFVFGNDQEQALYRQLFDKFEEENNCVVESQFCVKDDYNQQITGMMTAQELPDVFYMGPENVKSYVDNGYVLDMKPILADAGLDTSDILQDILATYEYEDGLYGLPHDSSVFAYAYNKDLFDAAGVEYPDPENPYTYDEFVEVCKKLTVDTDGDGEIDQFGCAFANQFMLYQFIWSNGASFCSDDYKTVTVTDPKFEEALQKWVDLVLEYGVAPTVAQEGDGPYQKWLDGKVAFYAAGTWDVGAFMDKSVFKYDWDLCGYPTLGTGKTKTWCGTVGYCVNANTAQQELATKLAYYMSASDEAMKLLSGIDGGVSIQIPNLVSMADNEFATAVADGTLAYPDNYNVLFNYLNGNDKYGSEFMESTYTPNSAWIDLFFLDLDTVKDGTVSVEEYCENIEPQMQEMLDEAWESQ